MSWTAKTLGKIANEAGGEIRTGPFGSQLHKSDYVNDVGATPVVMPKNMVNGRIDVTSIARIDDPTLERLSSHILNEGDIVLGRRGEIGRRAWVGEDEAGWLCGTGSMRVSVDNHRELTSRYLYYYLELPQTVEWLKGHSVGATMSNLSASVVQQLPVAYPSFASQLEITNALDNFEDLIENNRQRILILEDIARLLYREWFMHFRFPGHREVDIVDSELGPIPRDWKVTKFGNALELVYGKALKASDRRNGPVAVFGSGGHIGWHDAALANGPGIVVGRKGSFGSVYWSDDDFYPIDTTYYVKSELPLRFVDQMLRTMTFVNSHAAVPGLSRDQAYGLQLVEPPIDLMAQYEDVVLPLYELRRVLARQCRILQEARDLMLPRLVLGGLDMAEFDAKLETAGV